MNTERIGVGIVGASTVHPGWATLAHIPAIRALPDLELKAVSTSSRSSAEAASRDLGVDAFDNHDELIAHPSVDLVVVTVKVPHHRTIVSSALAAGKMVYCEWPLGRDLTEAIALEEVARSRGIRCVVGLQGRASPSIRFLRDLVASGYIGEVLATTLVGSGSAWGASTPRSQAYLYDIANGATLLSITGMHALDALTFILGEFSSVSARLAVRRKTVRVIEDDARIPVSAPDQVAMTGTLRSGAVASVFYRGGTTRGNNLHWEINGSLGDLIISRHVDDDREEAPGNIQIDRLKIEAARDGEPAVTELPVPAAYYKMAPYVPAGWAQNVGFTYAQFAQDLREGTTTAPSFTHALSVHKLMSDIELAAAAGIARTVAA